MLSGNRTHKTAPSWRGDIMEYIIWEDKTMKKTLILAIVIFIALFGYIIINSKEEVTIRTGIEVYTPVMSSFPGIPLTPEYSKGKSQQGIIYQWTTEQGQFINWDNSKVQRLGKEIKNEGAKIYWTVDFEQKEEITPFNISLKVINVKTGKTITQTKIQIQKNGDGFYIVK